MSSTATTPDRAWADTIQAMDHAADHATAGAATVMQLVRSGRIADASRLMHQRGTSLRTALDVLRACRIGIRPLASDAAAFEPTQPAHYANTHSTHASLRASRPAHR